MSRGELKRRVEHLIMGLVSILPSLYYTDKCKDLKLDSIFFFFSGSKDAAMLLCVGISIGIMSSFVANQTEVNKVREELKETESLVKDSEDGVETKDSLTVNDDELHDGEKTAENSESIGEIEAELVAELEMLQMNMNSSNIETQPSDVFEVSKIRVAILYL